MKRNLLIALFLLGILVVPAKAAMSVEESTDAEYLINSGFSQVLVEDVFVQKNRATAKPIEPLYEKSQNGFVKALKKLHAYVDPAQETPDKIHHDIKDHPSFTDL